MQSNVGKTDRILRVVLGLCIIGAGLMFQSWLGAIGVVLLVTAAVGWCPMYLPLGFSSCKKKS